MLLIACATNPPSPPKSAADELTSFELADAALEVELVAAEPLVQDPVCMSFDHLGRMWVAEMTGFNATMEGRGENEPNGHIVVLQDLDDDGKMDTRTVFLDSLVLPRALALVDGGLLVAERFPLWYVEDLDGDLVADRKTLVDSVYGGQGHVEHSPNGLWRGIDNWYYNAKSRARYRKINDQWHKETTEFRGQWGISHDNFGRLYYNYNWSQLHADLVPPNYFSRNPNHETTTGLDHGLTLNRSIYPIRPNPAVNRGYITGTLDSKGMLLEFTSACAPFVFREKALLPKMVGDVFVCEPSGNLVKRNKVVSTGYMISATDAYPSREFLASTDERFRPVNLASGPDGALYIVDMYRGLIEHWKYMTPYLRDQTIARKLETPRQLGRIWRVRAREGASDERKIEDLSSNHLVQLMSHDGGWKRDMAQRLLVERQDADAIPLLESVVQQSDQPLARLHALWTLEGMQAATLDIGIGALDDPHPQVRAAAYRVLEHLLEGDFARQRLLLEKMRGVWKSEQDEVVLQMILTAGNLKSDARLVFMSEVLLEQGAEPLIRDAVVSGLGNSEVAMLDIILTDPNWNSEDRSRGIFLEMLASAIGKKGEQREVEVFLGKIAKEAAAWQLTPLLTGLLLQSNQHKGSISLTREPALHARLPDHDEPTKSKVEQLAKVFTWPGNVVEAQMQDQTITLDAQGQQLYALGRKHYITSCSACHGDDGQGVRRFAPPLAGSEWVLENERRLVLILLHGLEGPITVKDHLYEAPEILPVMPANSVLDDKTLAAIITYIRNEWGNHADPVPPATVGHIRHRSQGRVQPWDVDDLTSHLAAVQNELE